MNTEELTRHLAARYALSKRFQANPHLFKVCDQCRSIHTVDAGLCRICGCYRFNSDRQTVIETSELLGCNPFPMTSAVVPRDVPVILVSQ